MTFFFLENKSKGEIFQGVLLLFTLVYFLKFLLMVSLAVTQNKFSFFLYTDISKKFFKKYINQDYLFHTIHNSAVLIRNVQTEANTFSFGVVYPLIKIISESIIFISICLLLIWYNPLSSLIAIAFFSVAGLILYSFTSRYLTHYGKRRQYHAAELLKALHQGFGSIKEIILYGLEDLFTHNYHKHNLEDAKAGRIKSNLIEIPRFALELVGVVTFVFVILVLLKLNQNISSIFVIIGVFSFAAIRLLPCVSKIVRAIQTIKFNSVVIELIDKEFKNYQTFIKSNDEKKLLQTTKLIDFEKMKFNKVSFSYPTSKDFVLKNINFEINKDDKIGIMGKSGSGKTTLVNLISGLLKCSEGEIFLNNENINQNLIVWQRKIGYVPQSVYIADESVEFNISLNDKNDTDKKKIDSLLQLTGLYEHVYNLQRNIGTIVGERGGRFSGGQCQRLGIARALYRDPSILILDEATSSLDEKTEDSILGSLFDNVKGKTIITISHRKNSLKYCDKIFDIKNGILHQID